MNIPTYLEGFIKDYEETMFSKMVICSSSGNDLLEVWYYGDLFEVKGESQPYIVSTQFAPEKIVAKDPSTGEEILLFDGAKHGYDNMFCEQYSLEQIGQRHLKQYPIHASKLILELGYSIDYDEEKEDYTFDENNNVVLINNSVMSWKSVKRNGFDYFGLFFEDDNGQVVQFVERELA